MFARLVAAPRFARGNAGRQRRWQTLLFLLAASVGHSFILAFVLPQQLAGLSCAGGAEAQRLRLC
jgi:hypothetical protein